nr:ShlB/FhaC/HecB family hemolysin secretion/activation protein [Saccharibacter sp. 17.LH.SD]
MVYRPGKEPGVTDVDLHVSDRFPVYAYAAVNNQADRTLGRLNWYVGASWGNAFGLGHIVTYQFNRTMFGRMNNHTASWTIPFLSRNALQIFGNYSNAYPKSNIPDLINRGRSGQASIRWLHMFQHWAIGENFGIDGTTLIGFDWKTTNSDQFSPKLTPITKNADTDQFVIGYSGSLQDPWGQTQINNQFSYSPGGFTHYNNHRDYNSIFPYAKPDYVYDRLILLRNQSLPYGLSSTTKVIFQRASSNLLYSEQFMIGGIGTVRGYFANTSFGSDGNAFSQEIYAPSFSLIRALHIPELEDTNKIGFFWDWADNRQVHRAASGARTATLSSIGLDLNSTFNRHLNLIFDTGWRMRRNHTNDLANRRGIFCDFQVIAGF